MKIRAFRDELNDVVDSFYIKKEYIKKPHKIYETLIEVINYHIGSALIDNIYCFIINEDSERKFVIVNSSTFVWNYKIEDETFIEDIRSRRSLTNRSISIESNAKIFNISIYSKVEEYEYVFFIVTKSTPPLYYTMIGFFRTLEPSFVKISKVLLSEKKLQELKIEETNKLSQRSQYVNRANKTMHFMRNRLGPFSNLVSQLDEFEDVPTEKQGLMKSLIFKEKDRAKIELKNITDRANDMLEKSSNPFVYNIVEQISLQKVYTILKRNVASFFPEENIILSIDNLEEKLYVKLNVEGFEMFLSDWLSNISKYKNSIVLFKFILRQSQLSIVFENNHTLTDEDINKMIIDLTSNNRNEIMKRTTHGLYAIKSTLEEMGVKLGVNHDAEQQILSLTLNLKAEEDESSNI